jgi:hexulose-6-phosphate isomerase
MSLSLTRRQFVAGSAAVAGAPLLGGMSAVAAEAEKKAEAGRFRHPFHKAVFWTAADDLRPIKAAGFEGVECLDWNVSPETARKVRKRVEAAGLRIHSVLRGWVNFNSLKANEVEDSLGSATVAIRAAEAYGADTILLVPCQVGGMPMPNPWEFDIDFDEHTGKLNRVVKGDNGKFQAYIDAQNRATETSRSNLRKLIPIAEAAGVIVGVEDVWNNLWVRPEFFKHLIVSCDSKWIQAYFDIANEVKYLIPPEQWIRTLGKLIVKCHVKDYKLSADRHNGGWPSLREGSVNWPAVRKALEEVGYDGWGTIEAPGPISLAEQNRRFDLIIEGK